MTIYKSFEIEILKQLNSIYIYIDAAGVEITLADCHDFAFAQAIAERVVDGFLETAGGVAA